MGYDPVNRTVDGVSERDLKRRRTIVKARCPKCNCQVECSSLYLADSEEMVLDSPCDSCIEKENEYKKEMYDLFRDSFLSALTTIKDGTAKREVEYCYIVALEAVKQWKEAEKELIEVLEETK